MKTSIQHKKAAIPTTTCTLFFPTAAPQQRKRLSILKSLPLILLGVYLAVNPLNQSMINSSFLRWGLQQKYLLAILVLTMNKRKEAVAGMKDKAD